MQKTSPCSFRRNENGSTILEMLVALFILSSLGIGAWRVVGVSMRLAGRIRDSALAGSRLVQLDDNLRGLAARILPPFWAPNDFVQPGEGGLRAPFLDGDPMKALVLSFRDGMLFIGDGTVLSTYSGYQDVAFSRAADKKGRVYGIVLEASRTDGRSITIAARFGGSSIGSAPSP